MPGLAEAPISGQRRKPCRDIVAGEPRHPARRIVEQADTGEGRARTHVEPCRMPAGTEIRSSCSHSAAYTRPSACSTNRPLPATKKRTSSSACVCSARNLAQRRALGMGRVQADHVHAAVAALGDQPVDLFPIGRQHILRRRAGASAPARASARSARRWRPARGRSRRRRAMCALIRRVLGIDGQRGHERLTRRWRRRRGTAWRRRP